MSDETVDPQTDDQELATASEIDMPWRQVRAYHRRQRALRRKLFDSAVRRNVIWELVIVPALSGGPFFVKGVWDGTISSREAWATAGSACLGLVATLGLFLYRSLKEAPARLHAFQEKRLVLANSQIRDLVERVARSKVIVVTGPAPRLYPRNKYEPRTGGLTGPVDTCRIDLRGLSILTHDDPITIVVDLHLTISGVDQAQVVQLEQPVYDGDFTRMERRLSFEPHTDTTLELQADLRPWPGDPWLAAVDHTRSRLIVTDYRNPKRTVNLTFPDGRGEL